MSNDKDYTLDTLLEMNGYILEVGNNHWVKIEARCVKVDQYRPAGIKYSLTLHTSTGERVLGYDNAHAASKSLPKSTYDHFHKSGNIRSYDYKDAASLLEDFWKDVERIIGGKEQ